MVLHPHFRLELAETRAQALRGDADRRRRREAPPPSTQPPDDSSIVIRLGRPEDQRALDRLAGLDSAHVPARPVLLAEADGELRAALSLHDGAVIADPFHRTTALVSLLSARAEQLRREPTKRRRLLSRLGWTSARAQRSGAPAR